MKKIIACALFFAVAANFAGAKTIEPAMPETQDDCFSAFDEVANEYVSKPCYLITNAEELYGFAAIVNGTGVFPKDSTAVAYMYDTVFVNKKVLEEDGTLVKDTADLIPWVPLRDFAGYFWGGTISGLYVNDPDADNVGLVANSTGYAVFEYLDIMDSYFEGRSNVGAYIGNSSAAGFYGHHLNSKAVVKGKSNVGGVAGKGNRMTFEDVESNGRVACSEGSCGGLAGDGGEYVKLTDVKTYGAVECALGDCGGVVGVVDTLNVDNQGSTRYVFGDKTKDFEFANVYNQSEVKCSDGNCGGFVGSTKLLRGTYGQNAGNVVNVAGTSGGIAGYVGGPVYVALLINEGKISGDIAGGIIGHVDYGYYRFLNSYSTGDVDGESYAGGLFGRVTRTQDALLITGEFTASFSSGKVSGNGKVDGLLNNEDLPTDESFYRLGVGGVNVERCVYLEGPGSYGSAVTAEGFADGTAVGILKGGVNTSKLDLWNHIEGTEKNIWGQEIGKDAHPVYSGKVTGAVYDINLDLDGGTLSGDCPTTYTALSWVELPVGVYPELAELRTRYQDEDEDEDDVVPKTPCTITKEGYAFVGWIDSGRKWTFADTSYRRIVTSIDGDALLDTSLKAVWSNVQHTITYYVEGEEYRIETFYYGAPYTLIDTLVKEGHYFEWNVKKGPEKLYWMDTWSEEEFRMPDWDVSIYGYFEREQYTVYFVADTSGRYYEYYGKIEDVFYGDTVSPLDTIPEYKYYTFAGWTKDGVKKYNFSAPVKGNLYLYPLWKDAVRTITVKSNDKTLDVEVLERDNDKTALEKVVAEIEKHSELTPVETYKDSMYVYTFKGWGIDGFGICVPQYTKEAIRYEVTGIVNDKKFTATLKTIYTANEINSVLSETASRNRDLNFTKAYSDSKNIYTFVDWAIDEDGYYYPRYKVTSKGNNTETKQDTAKQDVVKQDSTKQDTVKNSETKQDTVKQDSTKQEDSKKSDDNKDAKKDSKKDAIPVLPVEFASMEVHGMNLAITGLANYSTITVHDMLGHAVVLAKATDGTCNIQLPHAGSYVVRIGNRGYKVSVK